MEATAFGEVWLRFGAPRMVAPTRRRRGRIQGGHKAATFGEGSHGKAEVINMLEQIGSKDNVAQFVADVKAKKA